MVLALRPVYECYYCKNWRSLPVYGGLVRCGPVQWHMMKEVYNCRSRGYLQAMAM